MNHLSKYALSNIFLFTDERLAISLRLASKKFDDACYIGLNIGSKYDIPYYIDNLNYKILKNFSQEE